MPAADLLTALQGSFPEITARPSSDWTALNVPAEQLAIVLKSLRDEHGFDLLTDVSGIDWHPATPRFAVAYHLFSSSRHDYVRVVAACPEDEKPALPSVVPLWPAADWHERETYDMFGIRFVGHPDLRRILMWETYPFFPLRKEFPLAGIETELPDDEVAAETKVTAKPAPMVGGPFVAGVEGAMSNNEPRAKDESWSESREKPGQPGAAR